MKKLFVPFIAALALNAQAMPIVWDYSDALNFNHYNPLVEAYVEPQFHILLAMLSSSDFRDFENAYENKTLDGSASWIVDGQVRTLGDTPAAYHTTSDIVDDAYCVLLFCVYTLTPLGQEMLGTDAPYWFYMHFFGYGYYSNSPNNEIPVCFPFADGGGAAHSGPAFLSAYIPFSPIPEPTTGLLALGNIALLLRRKRN